MSCMDTKSDCMFPEMKAVDQAGYFLGLGRWEWPGREVEGSGRRWVWNGGVFLCIFL